MVAGVGEHIIEAFVDVVFAVLVSNAAPSFMVLILGVLALHVPQNIAEEACLAEICGSGVGVRSTVGFNERQVPGGG